MDSVLDLLLTIQHLNDEIENTEAQLKKIPKETAKLEMQIEARESDLKTAEARIVELKKDYKLKELEIADNEAKSAKLNTQTFAVKTNEEYRAILSEVDFIRKKNREIEDEMIIMMEEEEKLKASIDRVRAEAKEFTQTTQERIAMLRRDDETLTEKLKLARAELDRNLGLLPQDIKALYGRISNVRGKAVCPIIDNTCTGCFASIPHQMLNEVKQRNKIVLCETCGRILVYTPSRT